MPEKHAFIETVREENERDFGPKARIAVQKLLDAGLPHPWMYVYELTQNAADAGARRVRWQIHNDAVVFQHDGTEPLKKIHVRALSSLGGSTKGLATVGYMGVGFKSVFSRFRLARISGFGWRFHFQVKERRGDLDVTIPEWVDTLRPYWDEEPLDLTPGFTTIFQLAQPANPDCNPEDDLARLASTDDPTPLAVLALRGLEEVQIGDVTWLLAVDNGLIKVCRREADQESCWRWKAFRAAYRPDDAAMRRFLEVRQQLHDDVDDYGKRIMRQVVALLPLSPDGLPKPTTHGRVYATLPTQIAVPFGFHLQADWLVNVDRQNLRDVVGDPWQMAIVNQIPALIGQLLEWLANASEEVRRHGYPALCHPALDDGLLAKPCQSLKEALQRALANKPIAPIHGQTPREFRCPGQTARLPARFQHHFGNKPEWRVERLFGIDLFDEAILGDRATEFARWLDWGREVNFPDISWLATLPAWWNTLDEKERIEALFALWDGVRASGWHDAPVVPTTAGTWVNATVIRWLNEEPPSDKEPGGPAVAAVLRARLPAPDQRLTPEIRLAVQRGLSAVQSWHANTESNGVQWFWQRRREVQLADLVRQACAAAPAPDALPLVEWLRWAMHRGLNRQDLAPLVLTEKGARKPQEALLADPLLETGHSRRRIFPELPALVADYAVLPDPQATLLFLNRLGVRGGLQLIQQSQPVERSARSTVAMLLNVLVATVEPANKDGYAVMNWAFPFDVSTTPADALQDWLTREYKGLEGKRCRWAESTFYGSQRTGGSSLCAWVLALQHHPWILCTDGERRAPGEVLLTPDLDFEEAPVAVIDAGLAQRLVSEGIRFGHGIPRAPALRRLARKGATELPDGELAVLLTEAWEAVTLGQATPEEFNHALQEVRLHGTKPLDRLVERAGAGVGLRGNLDGWVLTLNELEPALVTVLKTLPLALPATTTGEQALAFLQDLWTRQPLTRLDDLRRHVAAAYRYVLDDLENNVQLTQAWQAAQGQVRVYGARAWHIINPELAVDDVQSPWIRRFLPDNRTIVAAAYLGDSEDQVRRVAQTLCLELLSDNVHLRPGQRVAEPPFATRLRSLINGLGSLDDRKPLTDVDFHDSLHIEISKVKHPVRAFMDGQIMRIAGDPPQFAAEAASQLVEYFQLSQKGDVIPWLTMALVALKDLRLFNQYIDVLGDGLGIDRSLWNITDDSGPGESKESKTEDDVAKNDDVVKPTGAPRAHQTQNHAGGGHTGHTVTDQASRDDGENRHPGKDREGDADRNIHRSSSTTTGPAADQFRGLLINRHDHSTGDASGQKRSDEHTREIVLKYEADQGRRAKAMDSNQRGYDIFSEDPATGQKRRIEVKGEQGYFEAEASVVLTAPQVEDALHCAESDTAYWLYVVDATDTDQPRVWPIPWPRYSKDLRYGFYASVWVDIAEQPAVVTPDSVEMLNSPAPFCLNDLLDPDLSNMAAKFAEDFP
ncbi:MAG: DUF3883 domain-containing protein [Candidatus Competibacter sp.]|nr:DUF3883 domain-containing protein [Candidatus Competibacter sp.]MDS4040951.1 DUF3883 domain-containing protein [Candidatus Competibacter sp.]